MTAVGLCRTAVYINRHKAIILLLLLLLIYWTSAVHHRVLYGAVGPYNVTTSKKIITYKSPSHIDSSHPARVL